MNINSIKFVDLKRQYESIKEDLNGAVNNVLLSGRYVGGDQVKKFENEFSEYLGVKFGLGVGSGSDALIIALQSLGIGKGDRVATVPFTFVSTADAILHVGATPVFVDINPKTLTMDPIKLKSVITDKIKAIIPVHLYGSPANMPEITELAQTNNIPVVEDAAQAHGAMTHNKKVGSIGKISCFSFYPAKNLGAAGDGGFIATNDSEVADKVALLREYGQKEKYKHDILGWNSRLDPIQAAILSVKLKHLDRWNKSRERIAMEYKRRLENIKEIKFQDIAEDSIGVYHIFPIMTKDRDGLKAHLNARNIETGIHYPVPVHLQKYYQEVSEWDRNELSNSERAALTELSLPMFPELGDDEIDKVAAEIIGYFR
ncbi:MAG: DegT/DnrJ/EryC1/StrS family aminotransferase [Candidatus Thermoplasmatota archaeon]|jgi:dTDP-4-amino-4,6-dideoxygalactose transaminase|nr:DegT/DnrJ/EryC1/StrS family aminotransferase [Candidatus Thermoplasmatota archaeon]